MKNKIQQKVFLIVVSITFSIYSYTTIGGPISETIIGNEFEPYIVEEDLVVPAGKILTIKDGAIFLFKPFTGIQVKGKLIVAGTNEKPVIFTSFNDPEYNEKSENLPNPFDWNGILIERQSNGAELRNFILRFSVYGIKSLTASITIQNGIFRQNGQFHCTINNRIENVADNVPFSYNKTVTTSTDVQDPNQKKNQTDMSKKTFIRYGCLGVGISGTIAGTVVCI